MAEAKNGKKPFDKPALPIPAQVDLLAARGLDMPDREKVVHYLTFISYYRLSGYCHYFYKDPTSQDPAFRDGTSFDDVLNLYIFDRQFRNLLMDALERIEVAAKATIANSVSISAGPFWLTDANCFDYGLHNGIMELVQDVVGDDPQNHQHQYISHFYQSYNAPAYPPAWMLMEALSFAAVSKVYQRLKGVYRSDVAKEFKEHQTILESWLHALSFARNVCAHHQRVWNRRFTIQPKIPHRLKADWPDRSRPFVYSVCAMIHYLMGVIADESQWSHRLCEPIEARPGVPLNRMGFPDDWAQSAFWALG